MAKIKVEKTDGNSFYVTVSEEGGGTSTYSINLDLVAYQRLSQGKVSPEDFVKLSFEFLLERETKESILSSFAIPETINRYFPEFESVIVKKVSR